MIEDESTAKRILKHVGLPARPPPRGGGGRRAQQELEFADAVGEVEAIEPIYPD